MTKVIIFSLLLSTNLMAKGHDVIYGKDNRYEIDSYSNEAIKKIGESVAIRVPVNHLIETDPQSDIFEITNQKMKETYSPLCANERFSEQNMLGDCSGFLIAPNILLTAGHCAYSEFDCRNNYWVFDFKEGTGQLKKSDVYSCKKIISQEFTYTKKRIMDYALIELDRVTNRASLKYRKVGFPFPGTPLAIVGHPLGLPMKVADGATVKLPNDKELESFLTTLKTRRFYFTANLDSYGGNSGSPVINLVTGLVEGILIQGEDDFKLNEEDSCIQSNVFSNSRKTAAEKVLRINQIKGL